MGHQDGCSAYYVLCQVVTMRMGWAWQDSRRGETGDGITTEDRAVSSRALNERWINPDEDDDIAASKFLCGGGKRWWKQLDNKGGVVGWQGQGTWVHLSCRDTRVHTQSHHGNMAGAGPQLSSHNSVEHLNLAYRHCQKKRLDSQMGASIGIDHDPDAARFRRQVLTYLCEYLTRVGESTDGAERGGKETC